MSPRIEAKPGEELREIWIYLSVDEARDLLAALAEWEEEGGTDPGWHTHIGARPDAEVTIAVGRDEVAA